MPVRAILAVAGLLVACQALHAQELVGKREFLTDYEIDVLRNRQDVTSRLEAYAKFAALRLELVEQTLETEEVGRGAKIHRALEEYSSIIQAVVADSADALLRNKKIDDALGSLLDAEQDLASRLAAIAGDPAEDAWRYEFVLEDAIDITRDSMDLLAEDLGVRKRTVVAQEEADRQRQKQTMAPERRREFETDKQREADAQAERDSRRPTLLRPGEKIADK